MDGRQQAPLSDAALDRELDAALDVDPSPGFLARVRQRVAEEPATGGRHVSWRWTAICGAAVSVIVLMVIANRSGSQGAEPAPVPSPVIAGSGMAASARAGVMPMPTAPARPAPGDANPVAPVRAPRPAGVRTATLIPASPRVARRAEIIVAQAERRALDQLLTLIRRDELPPLPAVEASTDEPSGVSTLEIAPVVIDPLPPIVGLEIGESL